MKRPRARLQGLARSAALLCLAVAVTPARATDVRLVGLAGSSAVVSIDGGPPRILAAGARANGVELLSVTADSAVFRVDGHRETLQLGEYYGSTAPSGKPTAILYPGEGGHYYANGSVNGAAVRFIVDTGASLVVLSGSEAHRLGIAYADKPRGTARTAGGPVSVYRVMLDTVKVGDIVLSNVDAVVQEDLPTGALLGMSFLSRTDMNRNGDTMVLTRRY